MVAPKIEPEIVLKMKEPLTGSTDAAVILNHVEWIALGFEIIDCLFPDWKFQPVDFVAALGLHKALIVGDPHPVTTAAIPKLAEDLPAFKLRLSKDRQLVEEGSGKNSLRSPALCLGELARVRPLKPGELVSSGTLTTSTLIAAGEEWTAEVEGIDLPPLALSCV
jgi:2-oxo-3-hexenedioate decarboxylase